MFPSTSLSHSNSFSPWVIGSTCFPFIFSPLDRRDFILTSRVFLKFANLKSEKKLMLCLLLSLKYLGFHRRDNRPTWVVIQFLPFYERHIQSAWMNRSSLRHPCADNRAGTAISSDSLLFFSWCQFLKTPSAHQVFSFVLTVIFLTWNLNFSISKSEITPKRDFVDTSVFVSKSFILMVLNQSLSKSKSPNISISTFCISACGDTEYQCS